MGWRGGAQKPKKTAGLFLPSPSALAALRPSLSRGHAGEGVADGTDARVRAPSQILTTISYSAKPHLRNRQTDQQQYQSEGERILKPILEAVEEVLFLFALLKLAEDADQRIGL